MLLDCFDISLDNMGCASYTLVHNNNPLTEIKLKVPGLHNVSNSLAALAAAGIMGCDLATAAKALLKFNGVCRRFEFKGKNKGVIVVDDYAHHPSEVATAENHRATLQDLVCFNRSPYAARNMDSFPPRSACRYRNPSGYLCRREDDGELTLQCLLKKYRTGKSFIH